MRRRTTGVPVTLLRFAVAGALGDARASWRAALQGRTAGLPRRSFEETALMLMLYAGYPAALETLAVLAAAWPGRPRRTREGGPAVWRHRGAALCRRVYGPVYGRLLARVRALHPDLAVWMVESGYGRVLARAGLTPRARELVTVAVLAACGHERQLTSHLLGAARLGAGEPVLREALRVGAISARARATVGRAWRTAFGSR